MEIRIKRVYEPADPSDGRRILIDRLWPRGVSKADAQVDFWARAVAPSDGLRRWYQHEPSKWSEFKRRYFAELNANPQGVVELRTYLKVHRVSLIFSSREPRMNNATALKEYLAPTVRPGGPRRPATPLRSRSPNSSPRRERSRSS